jgi:hypothetical protein
MRIRRAMMMLPALIALGACVTTAHLYDLDSGEVLSAKYQNYGIGHGTIVLTRANGATLQGEYSTISGMGDSSAETTASATGSGGYAWATAQGFSFNQPGQQYGAAIVAGDGLVIEVVYVTDPWTGHGHGVGKDNKGGRYNLQF